MNVPSLSVIPRTFYVLLERVLSGVGFVKTGLNPTATGPGDRHVSVAAGSGVVNGVAFSYIGGTVLPAVADANPRYDLVVIANGAASPSVITGVPSNAPIAPTLPVGDLVLGLVYLPANATDYTTGGFVADYTLMYGFGNGTAASPSLPFASDYTTGIYRPGAGKLGITISGAHVAEFGATYMSVAASPAQSGHIRLPNASYLTERNGANSADVRAIGVNSGNQIVIDPDASGTTVIGSAAIAIGSTPATSGAIRLPYQGAVNSRDSANTFNEILVRFNSDTVELGTAASSPTKTGGTLTVGGAFMSVGSPAAGAQAIRLTNNDGIAWRNVGNSANLLGLYLSSGDDTILQFLTGKTLQIGEAGVSQRVTIGSTFLAVGTTPATAGHIRLPNTAEIHWRNAANNANMNAVLVTSGDQLQLGTGTVAPTIFTTAAIAIGSTPATVGYIRLPNNTDIYFRNAANSANVHAIGVDGSDNVLVKGAIFAPKTLTAEQATTSGTSKDFTGIPAGTKRITVMVVGVSTNGTSPLMVQIGDSGGIETAGYTGMAISTGTAEIAYGGTGFELSRAVVPAASTQTGQFVLTLQDASDNTWVGTGLMASIGTVQSHYSAGSKATSAVLDRVRLTTINGTDTFDAGVVSIMYE